MLSSNAFPFWKLTNYLSCKSFVLQKHLVHLIYAWALKADGNLHQVVGNTNISDWPWTVFTPEFITTRLYDSAEKYLPTFQFLQLWIKTKQGNEILGWWVVGLERTPKLNDVYYEFPFVSVSNECKARFICTRIYPTI